MLSRRQLVIRLTACSTAVLLSAFPWKFQLGNFSIADGIRDALAQGKGSGKGRGAGNGRSKGAGQGRGNSGGNSGNNSGGNGPGKGDKGKGNAKNSGKSAGAAPAADAPESPDAPSVDVHHGDGIQEAIKGGRYIMKDRQGRVIIDRKATAKDRFRLHSFLN